MRRSILLVTSGTLLLAGCAYGPFHRNRNYVNDGTGFGRKLVVEKRPKSVLVAFDATVCMVDEKRYNEVHLRDDVWCNWRREGGGDGSLASPSGDIGRNAEPLAARGKNPAASTIRPKNPKTPKAARPPKAAKPRRTEKQEG
jgi:hypothetical protein